MSFPETRVGDGAIAIRLKNKTGAASIKGTLVEADSVDFAFELTDADCTDPMGVVQESGIADGSWCWVAIYGVVEVLLKDTTTATAGYWVRTSDTAGRANATTATPPGGGIPALDIHSQEIGHCLETKTAGTSVLCKIVMHFN